MNGSMMSSSTSTQFPNEIKVQLAERVLEDRRQVCVWGGKMYGCYFLSGFGESRWTDPT